MLIIPPAKRRHRRPPPSAAAAPPPPPAVVVSTGYGSLGTGGYATLAFDRPVTLAPGAVPDDAVTFIAGYLATAVSQADDSTLYFVLTTGAYAGAAWGVNRQPAWVTTAVASPQNGTF